MTNIGLGQITVLADLSEFGDFDGDGAFDAGIDMDILTPAEVAAGEPGAAVEVFVRGLSQGFATPGARTIRSSTSHSCQATCSRGSTS